MYRVRKKTLVETLLFSAFFIITISYADLVGSYGMWNMVKYAGIGLLVAAAFFRAGNVFRYSPKIFGMFAYFFVITLISVMTQKLSAGNAIMALCYPPILFFYVMAGRYILKTPTDMRRAAAGIISGVILVLILSVDQSLQQIIRTSSLGRLRIYGAFSHPNMYASMLLGAIVLLDAAYRQDDCAHKRALCKHWTVILLLSLLILLTNSRTTMILEFVYFAVIYYDVLKKKIVKRDWKLYLMVVLVVLVAGGLVVLFGYVLQQETIAMRLDDYERFSLDGIEILFGHAFTSSKTDVSFEFAPYTILYRLGLLGLLGFMVLLMTFVFRSYRRRKRCGMVPLACSIMFALSALAEGYIINITNLFSCVMYLLIGSYFSVMNEQVRK